MANELSGLRSLTTHKMGFRIAVAAATIGIIYGYDLGAISGALLFIKDDFGLSTKQTEWVTTIVVAGSVLGALVGGRIANAIGRNRRWSSSRSPTRCSPCSAASPRASSSSTPPASDSASPSASRS